MTKINNQGILIGNFLIEYTKNSKLNSVLGKIIEPINEVLPSNAVYPLEQWLTSPIYYDDHLENIEGEKKGGRILKNRVFVMKLLEW